jgi:hypothetical protein
VIRTSDSLLHDFRDMDRLIAALSTPFDIDDEDIEELRWLRARRRFLLSLLAVRRDQRGKKVVSLELWRHGNVTAPSGARKAVTAAAPWPFRARASAWAKLTWINVLAPWTASTPFRLMGAFHDHLR